MPRTIFEIDKIFVIETKYEWSKYNLYWGFEIKCEIPDLRKCTKIVPLRHAVTRRNQKFSSAEMRLNSVSVGSALAETHENGVFQCTEIRVLRNVNVQFLHVSVEKPHTLTRYFALWWRFLHYLVFFTSMVYRSPA